MRIVSFILVALSIVAVSLSGQEPGVPDTQTHGWPQWRGPLATGVSPTADPPTDWSETENVRWKVELPGHGSASPIVWDDQVFILSAIPAGTGPRQGGQDYSGACGIDSWEPSVRATSSSSP